MARVRPAETRLPQGSAVILGLLVSSAFVVLLTETIMGVALPRLMDSLAITATTAQWLTTAYMLTMAVVIPTTGFLLQRFGTRTMFLTAMGLFSLGTLIAAIAPGFGVLLVGRVVQAAGTAAIMPLLMTTALAIVPAGRRGSMMGLVAVVVSSAPALGPTVAGAILDLLDWRGLFWFVLPIALAGLIVGFFKMRNVGETTNASIDLTSVLLSTIAFGGIVYGLATIGEGAHAPVNPFLALVIGAAGLVAFVIRQLALQKRDRALLDLRVFRDGTFTRSFTMMALVVVAQFGVVILLPLYMQNVLGLSAFQAGLALLPGGLLSAALAVVVGATYDRVGARPIIIPATVVFSIALWGMTTLGTDSPVGLVIFFHILMSIGLGGLFTTIITSALGTLPGSLQSHGSAAINTVNQLGGALGTAIFISLMTSGTATAISQGSMPLEAAASGVQLAFLAGAIVSLACFAGSFFIGSSRRRRATIEPTRN